MPTYLGVQSFSEFGINVQTGLTTSTEHVLTEVIVNVPTPALYQNGETVQLGGIGVTGRVWGNDADGLRLIAMSGTIPTTPVVITGVTSGQTQTGTPTILCTRTSDSPVFTALLSRQVLTSTGVADPKTILINRQAVVVIISDVEGGPILISNDTTGTAFCEIGGPIMLYPDHRLSRIVLGFAAAGGCTVQQFKDTPWTGTLKGQIQAATLGVGSRGLIAPELNAPLVQQIEDARTSLVTPPNDLRPIDQIVEQVKTPTQESPVKTTRRKK